MQSTPERGYPYPECDPPLTKDVSDIVQLRDFALAVDTDVNNVFDRAADLVVRPDAARMTMSATLPDTANTLFPVFDARTFDTTGTLMTDVVAGIMRLPEQGWYSVGCMATLTTATYLGARARFLMNGIPVTSFSTQCEIVASNQQLVQQLGEIYAPTENATLTIEIRIGAGSPSYTYQARIWAEQTVRL